MNSDSEISNVDDGGSYIQTIGTDVDSYTHTIGTDADSNAQTDTQTYTQTDTSFYSEEVSFLRYDTTICTSLYCFIAAITNYQC